MKQISFRGRQLLFYLHTPALVITRVSMITLTFDAKCQSVAPKSRVRRQASSLFHRWPFLVPLSVKMPNTGRISAMTEIFGGQTVALHQHQMPSAFKTTDSCLWYKTPDMSVIQKSDQRKKWEGDLVNASLHHGSSEAWSYRYIYRPADRIQIIRQPSG